MAPVARWVLFYCKNIIALCINILKAGYMAKSFKLKRDIVEQFEEACRAAGVSQAAQITKMMNEFIEEQKQNS